MSLTLDQLSRSAVVFNADTQVLGHAAAELRTHVPAIATGPVSVALTAGNSASDGFVARIDGSAVAIAGDSPRGTLNGVYWLLEQLGYAWVRPGEHGRRFVPGRSLAEGTYRESPSFRRRTLILGNDALHDEWRDWLEFASRNRYNSVFLHDTPPSVLDRGGATRPNDAEGIAADGKGWMFERWDSDGAEILRAAAERGIALQFGGHHLPGLLKRELFADHPDWFPMRKGARDSRYNLCTSSEAALAEVRARARDFFARFGGAKVYHLWADDIVGGGWCGCADCAALTPSDQAMRATNVLAEALAETHPSAVIAHLAYHDTISPPTAFPPATNVSALYAPRNRNYAFAIDDPACPHNSEFHHGELRALASTFAGRPESLAVFEYYSDAILYKWLDPPNLAILPADARAYLGAGVHDFGNLAVSPRPWIGPTWHAWWFARCAWDANADPGRELERFTAASFGADGATFAGLIRTFDDAYRLLLDLGELERIPRHDVLDFSDTPREALTHKAAQLREAVALLNGAVANLPLSPDGLGREFREDVAIQLAAANHLAARIGAWDAALSGRRAEAEAELVMARMHLSAIADWDRAHSAASFANLSRNMLRSATWHTERIASLLQ